MTRAAEVTRLVDRKPDLFGSVRRVRAYSKATGTARSVLLAMATYADPDGSNCRPSNETLAEQTGLSVRTVQRAFPKLVELGEIVLVRRGSGRSSSEWRITVSPTVENPVENDPPQSGAMTECHPRDDTVSRQGRHSVTQPTGTAIDREGVTFPDHCPAHRTVEDPPPCRKCQRTREANAAIRAQAEREKAAEDRRRRLEATREEARRAAANDSTPETRATYARQARESLLANRSRSGTLPNENTRKD